MIIARMGHTFWIRLAKVYIWGNNLMLQCQDCFHQACRSRGAFGMTNVWFHLLHVSFTEELRCADEQY